MQENTNRDKKQVSCEKKYNLRHSNCRKSYIRAEFAGCYKVVFTCRAGGACSRFGARLYPRCGLLAPCAGWTRLLQAGLRVPPHAVFGEGCKGSRRDGFPAVRAVLPVLLGRNGDFPAGFPPGVLAGLSADLPAGLPDVLPGVLPGNFSGAAVPFPMRTGGGAGPGVPRRFWQRKWGGLPGLVRNSTWPWLWCRGWG